MEDYERVLKKLDALGETVTRIDENMKSYPQIMADLQRHTIDILTMKQNCQNIQNQKLKINKGVIVTQIIIGTLLLLIGYLFSKGVF